MLCKKNIIDGCISEDTDILPNGGHLFLRNFNADKNTIEEYCLHGILTNLNLTNDKFIDLCILCGCDYTTKINGLGPITAYKLISKYDNIETFIENNKKFIIPENFNYVKARSLFKNPIDDDIFNSIDKNTRMIKPKMDDLKNFLNKTTLKDKFLKEIDKNLINYYLNIEGLNQLDKLKNNGTKKITEFFNKS
jgi:flap endonuclease-1